MLIQEKKTKHNELRIEFEVKNNKILLFAAILTTSHFHRNIDFDIIAFENTKVACISPLASVSIVLSIYQYISPLLPHFQFLHSFIDFCWIQFEFQRIRFGVGPNNPTINLCLG